MVTIRPKCAVIGIGNMGKNHVRVLEELNYEVIKCDSIKGDWKYIKDYKELMLIHNSGNYNKLKFIVIATPTKTHAEIAEFFLEKDIPVLIEKPICYSNELKKLEKYKDKIMIGHIEQFNPVINKINELKDKFGRIISVTFKRVGFYPNQIDENIIIDFQIHDLNNSLYLFGKPQSVYSSNIKGKNDKFDDSISILKYADKNVILQTSWNTPFKLRQVEMICEKGTLIGNLINQTLKLESSELTTEYKIKKQEPLKSELEHFIDCIKNNKPFRTNYQNAKETLILGESLLRI